MGLVVGVWLVCWPSVARAGFDLVIQSPYREWAKTVLDSIYFGGSDVFTPSLLPQQAQLVYTGRGITATRMDDFGMGGPLNINNSMPGQVDDQIWTGGPFTATVKFRRASLLTSLSYAAAPNEQPVRLLSCVVGDTATISAPPAQWIWKLDVTYNDGLPYAERWSQNSLNLEPDGIPGQNYLLTYRIDGLADGKTRWLLFWGDGPSRPIPTTGGWYSATDYDDLVVEITPTPEPATLGGLLLGAAFALRRRR
jgi:hypothetical protein